ncbi:MAG: TdeIII family type II restriction endonuclease [Candidatus Tagabacteria bacterium CG10_big_fil_rev_8_21_14_0_10_40_13]|uniref:type II site-specific deoxyribonuclease n=1 Tax=Candidatus Tagabacteria bacterium CG10_big_fil_rev_8_21_14_0_10_40_13 TaxID=1975022 RepID=A0A2M8L814_9BACT|nr:MAG: TdeIII family type II restriction endonuclease [Candidatus Tagabacteria bacterium CG10_big_fil_rev_8_21_14_0_10_40_13]
MALSKQQHDKIKNYLIAKIREKLSTYSPETQSMPFHFRLLGKDRMALFSFIQSVNTTLGTSIFEKVGQIIAEPLTKEVKDRYDLEGFISEGAVLKIDSIMRELRSATRKPNKDVETKEVLAVSQKGNMGKKLKKRVDLFVVNKDEIENYIEIKTAKPNINEFIGIKKQLLDWIAMRGSIKPDVKIKTFVAIPYNPYEPQPYERWTLQGLFDLEKEILVGKEFWDVLGGEGIYDDLLKVFEEAGIELRDEIDKKMKGLNKK